MSSRWIANITSAMALLLAAPFASLGGTTAAAQTACLTERAAPGARVLLFTHTAAFRHGSIPAGATAIKALGERYGFAVEQTEDPAEFRDDRLDDFGAVIFLSTTGDVLNPAQEAAFQRFIRAGGGFVGIHAAADTEHDWPWYGQLVGAYFQRHPQPQQANIAVVDRTHISTRCLPALWTRTDEWYDYKARPAASMRILANLDESSYQGGQMGNPHPIAWYHEFEGGRAWYTGFGHSNAAFAEPALLDHLAGGILWALTRPAPAAAAPAPAAAPRAPTAAVDFSPKPPVLPVSVSEQLSRFVLQPGYRLEPVLTEPNILEPTQIAFDGNGRMFVLEMRSYMQDADGTNELTPVSRISLHDDKDGDGVYEWHTVFVDSMVLPRFVMPFGPNSILTAESNEDEVWIYTDRNDDGVADSKRLFSNNFGRTANIEHQPANMTWAMDNWLYTTYNSYRQRWTLNGVLREATANPGGAWGVTQDDFGKTYIQEGATGLPAYTQFPIRYGDFQGNQRFQQGLEIPYPLTGLADYQPGATASHPDGKLNRVTGSAGNDVVRAHRMPADLLGDYLHGEPVARIVRRFNMVDMGGLDQFQQVYQDRQEEFIRSTDPLFRPVQIETAPDGTVYIVDMYRGIIQEGNWTQPGSYLRGKVEQYAMDDIIQHGRIWRLTYEGLPRDTERPRMNNETPAELVRHLEHPNGWWRDTAQRLLVLYRDRSVAPALEAMARRSENQLARYHAMWTLEGLGALTPALVRELMADPSPEMRIQAIRASETLYKAGDLSFAADYRRATTDADTDVVIQGLLTLQYFQVPDMAEIAQAVKGSRQETGITFVADRILQRRPAALGGGALTESETALLQRGREIYDSLCTSCRDLHPKALPTPQMADGWMMQASLSGNPWVTGHRDYVIKALLHGLSGPDRQMMPLRTLDDESLAALASYVRFAFSNGASPVTPADVAAVRQATASRTTAWTHNELVASLPKTLTPDRRTWKVTASDQSRMVVGSTGDPLSAFNYEGWSTGVPQAVGQWFQIELPEAVMLTELEFQAPIEGGAGRVRQRAAPLRLRVEVSMDGTNPTVAAEVTPDDSGTQVVSFAPVQGRVIRLVQVGTPAEGAPRWTMRRMKLHAAP